MGNTIIFILTTIANVEDVSPFGFAVSMMFAIYFNGYAYLYLKFTKMEIMQLVIAGIICGFITPLIFINIGTSVLRYSL